MGKMGAALGAYAFPTLLADKGLPACMYVCSAVAVTGVCVTALLTPQYGAADLEHEDSYIPLEPVCLQPAMEEEEEEEDDDDDEEEGLVRCEDDAQMLLGSKGFGSNPTPCYASMQHYQVQNQNQNQNRSHRNF